MAERGTPNPVGGGSSPPSPAITFNKVEKMEKLTEFLKGVREELKRVVWPKKDTVVKATISVIVFSVIIGVYLWILDLIFTKIISFILSLRGSL